MDYTTIINNFNHVEECNNNNKIKKPKILKLLNRQQIIMNNYKETTINNNQLVLNNIYSTDDEIYSQIYNQISNPYQKRLNTIGLLLKSDLTIPMSNMVDIIRLSTNFLIKHEKNIQ